MPLALPRKLAFLAVLGVVAGALLHDACMAGLNAWRGLGFICCPPGTLEGSPLARAVEYFVTHVPKLLLLLAAAVFVVSFIRSFFTAEKTRALLAGRRRFAGNVLAASLGVVTPFCSCSAVSLFIGFVRAGVPLGVTFSFLIAAPMVNEIALGLLLASFGWKVAGLYLLTGLLIAIFAGVLIGRMSLERHVEPWVQEAAIGNALLPDERLAFRRRLAFAYDATREVIWRVWPFLVIAIALGAAIHGYVPENALAGVVGRKAWWSVPASVASGVPLYANAAAVVPVVKSLLDKGAALGTVLAFMMAVTALSLPEIFLLRTVLRARLIALFVATVAAGILLVGYLFNWLL